jgi:integrase
MRRFTDAYIRGLKPKAKPYKRAEYAPKGEGRLTVRVLPGRPGRGKECVKEFFYRYRVNGTDKTIALGRYDPAGTNGKTLAAINAVLRQRRELQRETGDVKGHLAALEREREIERRKGTLRQLLDAYADALENAGKPSHIQARGVFRRNVVEPFPTLANSKANEIEPSDIQRILARMVKAGITRQVNVTRSYLRAAFQWGAEADHDPRTMAKDGVLFGLKSNPVATVARIEEYERVGERTLTEEELRAFWKAIDKLPPVQKATLRLNLALASQRPTQLLRAGWSDFDFRENTLLLKDSKGRGGSRDHLLPLTSFALEQLKPLREANSTPDAGGKLPSPFTSDGKRAMVLETLSVAVREVSDTLKKDNDIPPFQLRDLRRTVETMLQKLGVEKEVRAHLLSHGRGQGVQGKHYERYDFLSEKRQALERWAAHVQRIIAGRKAEKVVALSTAA